jgi:polyisoprenyl-phosphate glycosyltransferase
MISIISPIYNEEENIEKLVHHVVQAMETTGEEFEFILVENGSDDRSIDIIQEMRAQDQRIKYLSLSRNFGHQGGISAGLKYASGNAVISMDGDLQHPPEILPQMIDLWKEGNDVVYTTKKEQNTCGFNF